MPFPISEMLIQRQLNHWNRYREFLCDEEEMETTPRGPVITVSRLTGSGGRTLATLLAERLELEFHDYSIVEKIAKDQNLSDAAVEQLDEKSVNPVNLWVQSLLRQRNFMQSQYKSVLTKIIKELAEIGSCVFLGRGANLILGHEATLRIRVVASMSYRMERVRQKTGAGKIETRAILEESDHNREEFVRKVFNIDTGQPQNFDLIFNADRISIGGMLELTMLALLDRNTDWAPVLKEGLAQE